VTVRVRRARPEDAAVVSAFGLALDEDEAVPGRRFTPDAVLRDGFGSQPRFIAFVAERDGEPVGFALATPSYETNWAEAGLYVGDIYVAPAARRIGVGRKLVAALAAEARRQGHGHLWWTSLPQRAEARAFYESIHATTEQVYAHALGSVAFHKLADEAE
jgi:GNAT superfamily N-acetyltransferase